MKPLSEFVAAMFESKLKTPHPEVPTDQPMHITSDGIVEGISHDKSMEI